MTQATNVSPAVSAETKTLAEQHLRIWKEENPQMSDQEKHQHLACYFILTGDFKAAKQTVVRAEITDKEWEAGLRGEF